MESSQSFGLLVPSAIACLIGIILHQCLFKRIELDAYVFTVLGSFVAAHYALIKILQFSPYVDKSHSAAFIFSGCIQVGLWTSVLLYRAFFHPLNNFSGPFSAKLSKFWSLYKVIETEFQWYRVNEDLHQKYGDYVRIGPREISITDPVAIVPVLGWTAKTTKGPWYTSMETSVHTMQDKASHRQRRRVWDNAFKESLSDVAPRIEAFTDMLLARIDRNCGHRISLHDLFQQYSFDITCALAFGEPMGFIDGRADASAQQIFGAVKVGIKAIGLLLHVPWAMKMVESCKSLPGPNPMKLYTEWSVEKLERRREMRNALPDIMGHLLKHTHDDAEGRALLEAESRLIIGAGSDTTATTITLTIVYLAIYPFYSDQLRKETCKLFSESAYSCRCAQPVLDSIIMEVLRLHPPVTFGSQRVTPAEGLRIGEVYIPPRTVVSIPPWWLGRDPRNFASPTTFFPDRWTSRPDMILNKSAFIPFSTGQYNCPGKGLAMMEIRSVIAKVVRMYDFWIFGDEEGMGPKVGTEKRFDERGFFEGIKDHFTIGLPPVEVVFERRWR